MGSYDGAGVCELVRLYILYILTKEFGHDTPPPRRNRNQKIIWFNPPYSVNVKNNIGRIFLRLIEKHVPRHHKYCKLFNRNNIKISYSSMSNMASVIRNHNTSFLKDRTPTDIKECSCRQKTECRQRVFTWISSVQRFS